MQLHHPVEGSCFQPSRSTLPEGTTQVSRCGGPIIDGCNAVVNSPYSRVFGVPMSYFGFIYYLYMFVLAARLASDPFSKSLRFRAAPRSKFGTGLAPGPPSFRAYCTMS